MQYQKRINLLDNNPSQTSKFRTRNWVKINDDSCGAHSTNSQIKFKNSMLKSSLCECSDAYILFKGMITVVQAGAATADRQEDWKDNTPVNNAKDLNFVTLIYSNNYSKISGYLYKFCEDEPNDNWRDSK